MNDAPIATAPATTTTEERLAALEARLARIERGSAPRGPGIDAAALYTLAETAPLLRCALSTAYGLARSGRLRTRSVGAGGKGYRVLGSDLLAFLRADDGDAAPARMRFKHLES